MSFWTLSYWGIAHFNWLRPCYYLKPCHTLPTTEQLNNAPQPTNPATTLAVSFVIYQDLSTNHLEHNFLVQDM